DNGNIFVRQTKYAKDLLAKAEVLLEHCSILHSLDLIFVMLLILYVSIRLSLQIYIFSWLSAS
ncbi:unnamed protein product, partial [Prunus brigantina]